MQKDERTQDRERMLQAIADGEFEPYYQFIVDRNGVIRGAEAVSRWNCPQQGLLSPKDYIGMMNELGTTMEHDFFMLDQVCQQLAYWGRCGYGELFLSCNFTRLAIANPEFYRRTVETVEKYAFNRGNLILEVTEDQISVHHRMSVSNIRNCRALGIRVALDDIGSGYSAISDLYNYPVDLVKIDRQLVEDIVYPRGKQFVTGLITLAHSMGFSVLCEGVEDQEQRDAALEAGCDYIQGFYYSDNLTKEQMNLRLNIV